MERLVDLESTARTVLGLLDLTSLNDDDSPTIIKLCEKSHTSFGNVAAICIYPRFIQVAKNHLKQHQLNIKIATVTNFPHGNANLKFALNETQQAIDLGVDEVDIVFPYKALIQGDKQIGAELVKKAKKICGSKALKVIIESGKLKTPQLIREASIISIENGADFIKTSTGKVSINATLATTEIMLQAIKDYNKLCSFKAAGGIRLVNEAKKYLDLTAKIMGKEWINNSNFRFGASSLLDDVLNILNNKITTN